MHRQVKEEDSGADGAQKDKQFEGFMVCILVNGFKISGNEEKYMLKRKRRCCMDRWMECYIK